MIRKLIINNVKKETKLKRIWFEIVGQRCGHEASAAHRRGR